jgi:NADH-quinone oxidoreductase subunit N
LLFAGAGKGNYSLIVIAALNMVVSLYYYLKVIKIMFMDANEHPIEKIKAHWQPKIAMAICVGGIIITGIASGAYNYIHSLLK